MSFNNFESDSYCVGGRHRSVDTKKFMMIYQVKVVKY